MLSEDYDFEQDDQESLSRFPSDTDLAPSGDDSEIHSEPRLRSRPPIDFRQFGHSAIGSDLNYSGTAFSYSHPHSYLSGSTLTGLQPSLKSQPSTSFSLKSPSINPLPTPRVPPAIIASLTIADLLHNPHYVDLRQKYDHVAGVLAAYVGQNLTESRVASCNSTFNVSHGA